MDRAEYARDATVEDDLAWVGDTLLAAARQVAERLAEQPLADPRETEDAWQARRAHLAALHALSVIQEWTATVMAGAAEAAGQAGASYADLGRAVGISKQAARKRWPEAIEDPRPGRPPLPPTLLRNDHLPAALAEEALEQALAAWPELTDPDQTDGGVPCQAWHPGPDGNPDEPATWSWQPGIITERCAPNEWVIEIEADESTCFRDISEIRPLDPARPAVDYINAVVNGLDHLGVPVLDSWTQEDDGRMEGLVEVQDDDDTGALGFAWNSEEGWKKLWRHGLKEPDAFSKYTNAEDAAAVDAPVGEVVRLITEAAGHNPDQVALL